MQENPTGSNMPVYASLSTMRQEPSQEEMNNGVIPLDTLPATWWNWMWNAITQAQNDSMYNDDVLFTEINNVLAAAGITPGTSQQHDQLRQAIMVIKDTIATTAAAGSVLSTDGGTTGTVKVGADGKMTVNNFGDIALFHGATKNNLIGAVNETYDIAFDNKDNIGEVGALTTIERNTLVGAINELDAGKAPKAHASAETTYGIGDANNYGHVKLTDTPGSDDTASGIAATPKLVQDMVSGGMGAVNAVTYTFVVDSNEKLAAWANATEGNDYTNILIRKGECTSNAGVNLTTTGTKVVVGEPGSKLVFNGAEKGLYYDTLPESSEYYMLSVTVVTTTEGTGEITGNSFFNCINLTNCTGSVSVTGDSSGQVTSNAFDTCKNLIDCTGTGIGTNPVDLNGRYNGQGRGFYNCINLTNCTGNASGTSKVNGNGDAFSSCTNLTNCTGNGSGTSHAIGFYDCINLTNCTGNGDATSLGSGQGYGFDGCDNLTNCMGTGTGTTVGHGFTYCKRLTNCMGAGIATDYTSSSRFGYGFSACRGVSRCRTLRACTSGAFSSSCYASNSETSTYACADTANGGFNDVTNSTPS